MNIPLSKTTLISAHNHLKSILLTVSALLGLFGFSSPAKAQGNDCMAYYNSDREIAFSVQSTAVSQVGLSAQRFFVPSFNLTQFLCSNASLPKECELIANSILSQAQICLTENLSVKELRPLATVFMRNPEFKKILEETYLSKNESPENIIIRKRIWNNFQVLVLPEGYPTPSGTTKRLQVAELLILEQGFKVLRKAVVQAVGEKSVQKFSHLWGAGGIFARSGSATIGGQFGEVWSNFPLQINLVINLAEVKISAEMIAQRLAHENSHSQDILLGLFKNESQQTWSENNSEIFKKCGRQKRLDDVDVHFYDCRNKNQSWFAFHKTFYPAINAREFYTKMVDEWVRENLNLNPRAKYRCQNVATENFWNEMEINLLGQAISPACQ